ncbi:MAG: hypothetical protein ACREBU_23935 [Nitrososphaera sp.]
MTTMPERLHLKHFGITNTEPPTPQNIIRDIMQYDADEKYWIQWDGEELAEEPAWLLFNPYSIGALNKKWTVYWAWMEKFEFKTKREADRAIRDQFNRAKQSGKLWQQKDKSLNLRLFATVEVPVPIRQNDGS